MTKGETYAVEKFTSEGWTVLRRGWPDFLCIKVTDNAVEVVGVEVKSKWDKVKPDQQKMHDALRRAGLRVDVLRLGPTQLHVSVPLRRETLNQIDALVETHNTTRGSMIQVLVKQALGMKQETANA